ncbi:DUF4267 domain-containing protein [Methylobacterium sp. SyP6R]|uniref:DUF4267 domain-containing protein n=1 Tax=Methylobacterium sp. SyP6R TaxID=2718876 RepID=UPI001F1E88FB|nr:DUF4267 domain-containing protein [Methylobacterium sp. SyP6R]MCF4125481.1 DUF4267 domain-containing protein [Methylobacterium sp. SyP6R]
MKAPARAFGHAGGMDRRHLATGDGRLSPSDLRLWIVLAMALVFLALGGVLLATPALGALIYGVPEPEGIGRTYLRAIGARDAALALHLAGLSLLSTRRAVMIVLAGSLAIPACDLALILSAGTAAWWQVALHGMSAGVLAVIALWMLAPAPRQDHSA